MAEADNKRTDRRAAADFVVELYDTGGQAIIGIAKLNNLSASGACVESTSLFDLKTQMVIRLLLGKRHLLTLPGQVVWVKVRGHVREYGIKFGSFPESAKALILRFVEEYFSQQKGMDFDEIL